MLTVSIVGTAYVLTALAYLIIGIRLTLRRVNNESVTADGYVILVSMVFYGFFTAAYPIVVHYLFCVIE